MKKFTQVLSVACWVFAGFFLGILTTMLSLQYTLVNDLYPLFYVPDFWWLVGATVSFLLAIIFSIASKGMQPARLTA